VSRYLVPIDPDESPELTVVLRTIRQSGHGFALLAIICEGADEHVLGRVYQTVAAGLMVLGKARNIEDRGVRFDGWGAPAGGVRTVGNYSRVKVAYRLTDADPDELARLQCACRNVSIPVRWMQHQLEIASDKRRVVFHAVPPT
jgi:hypothetical protein